MKILLNPKVIEFTSVMAFDLETSGLSPVVDKVRLIVLMNTNDKCYVLDTTKYSTEALKEHLENLAKCETVVAHNAKFDCGFIYSNYGILLRNMFCTMCHSQMLTNGQPLTGNHGLVDTVKRYLNKDLLFGSDKKLLQLSFTNKYFQGEFSEKQLNYAAEDVIHLIPLYETQNSKIIIMQMDKISKLEMSLLPILAKMEVQGCKINVDGWRQMVNGVWKPELDQTEKRLDEELLNLSKENKTLAKSKYVRPRNKQRVYALDIFGGYTEQVNGNDGNINYSSSDQILELFRIMDVPVPMSAEKESVDETTLTTYMNENPKSPLFRFIKILMEYRELAKLISTYGEKFLDQLDSSGAIHTQYTQTYTATGRLSSKAPNLQNIPKSTKANEKTRNIRKFFMANKGMKLLTCDMSSAEIRIAADYSKEPLLLRSILEGADMHSELATTTFSIVFGRPVVIGKNLPSIDIDGHIFVPEELRDDHKRVVFAKFYKAGAKRVYSCLAGYINLFYEGEDRMRIASEVSEAIDKKMPQLTKYLTGLIKEGHKKGYLRGSKLGRVRFFDKDAYGELANLPIQCTNAEALKIALIKLDKYFDKLGYGRTVMNIHDEVVCEVPEEHAQECAQGIRAIMAESLSWFLTTVKGDASIKIAEYWEK